MDCEILGLHALHGCNPHHLPRSGGGSKNGGEEEKKEGGISLDPCDGGFLWVVVEWNGRARHPSVLGGSALVGSSSSNSSEVLGERVQVAGTSSGVPLRRREWMPPAKCSADSISSGLFVSFFLSFFTRLFAQFLRCTL